MPEMPATEDRRPPNLLWLTAAIPFLLLVGFTVQGSVEVQVPPEHSAEVLVDGKPARPFTPGIYRTGLMLIGPHEVTIREVGRPERRTTAFVWLSQRVAVHDGSSSQPQTPVVPSQSEPSRPGTEASTPAAAIDAPSPANTFDGGVLEIRLFNVDDAAAATINGTQVLSARYRDDTGFVNLTDRCDPGANQIGFQLDNLGSGYTWGFEMRVDGRIVWRQEEGLAGSRGARNDDRQLGRVVTETVTFVRRASAPAPASSNTAALDGSERQSNNGDRGFDEFGWEEQEVSVSARDQNGATTRPLAPNTAYDLEVSGTWDAWGDTNHAVDAVECFAQPRCTEARKRKLYQSLRVDGQGLIDLSEGTLAYDDAHVYRVRLIGRGQPLTLVIGDAVRSGGDNSGSLVVRISKAR